MQKLKKRYKRIPKSAQLTPNAVKSFVEDLKDINAEIAINGVAISSPVIGLGTLPSDSESSLDRELVLYNDMFTEISADYATITTGVLPEPPKSKHVVYFTAASEVFR